MAASMTYDSLLADISVYAERDDTPFMDQRERFIMMAENRIAAEVKGLGMMKFVTGTLGIGDPVVEKPSRWRETVSLSITTSTGRKWLFPREYQYCRSFWPDPAVTGEPKYYSDYSYEYFLVVGTPDIAYPFEFTYFERPEPLSTTNQTNWITQYAPQLILYASLLEAQPFLKLDGRTAQFQALYDRAVQAIGQEAGRRMKDFSQQRSEG